MDQNFVIPSVVLFGSLLLLFVIGRRLKRLPYEKLAAEFPSKKWRLLNAEQKRLKATRVFLVVMAIASGIAIPIQFIP